MACKKSCFTETRQRAPNKRKVYNLISIWNKPKNKLYFQLENHGWVAFQKQPSTSPPKAILFTPLWTVVTWSLNLTLKITLELGSRSSLPQALPKAILFTLESTLKFFEDVWVFVSFLALLSCLHVCKLKCHLWLYECQEPRVIFASLLPTQDRTLSNSFFGETKVFKRHIAHID